MMAHDPSISAAGAALHALDDDERASFEAHLSSCDACRAELAEFQETLGRVGSAMAELPPASLRSSVLAAIAVTRQLPPEVPAAPTGTAPADDTPTRPVEIVTPPPPEVIDLAAYRRRWVPRVLLAAAAAVVAVAITVGLLTAGPAGDIAGPPSMQECIAAATDTSAAAAAPDSVGASDVLVSPSCGGALVKLSQIPAAPSGFTYQMWVMTGSEVRSVGVMDPDDDGTMPEVVADLHVGDTAIGVTVEPTGGSATPTTTPVVMIPLTS